MKYICMIKLESGIPSNFLPRLICGLEEKGEEYEYFFAITIVFEFLAERYVMP